MLNNQQSIAIYREKMYFLSIKKTVKNEAVSINNKVYLYFTYREFEVDSINFKGQVHRWRLSNLLQKGTQNAQNTLFNVSA
jgi:general stress protein 26